MGFKADFRLRVAHYVERLPEGKSHPNFIIRTRELCAGTVTLDPVSSGHGGGGVLCWARPFMVH